MSWYPLVPAAIRYTFSSFLSSNDVVRSTDPEVRKQNIPGMEFARIVDFPQDIRDQPHFFAQKCDRFTRSTAIVVNDVEAWDPTGRAVAGLLSLIKQEMGPGQENKVGP